MSRETLPMPMLMLLVALLLTTPFAIADNGGASDSAPVIHVVDPNSAGVDAGAFLEEGYTPEQVGLAIAREADRRDTGFGNAAFDLTVTLLNPDGSKNVRRMRQQVLEVVEDGDKTLIVFEHPPDLKGTALLTYSHKRDPDDQWLYLPALKRTKRISSADKSGPFMGSEFAFEDLGSQEVEKYEYRYLRKVLLDDKPHLVIERIPIDENSGYTRQEVWLDSEYRARKIDFYDRKNALLKTQMMQGYRLYLDRFWRADLVIMTNHQTGRATEMAQENFRFRRGLAERDFSREALSRVR